MNNKDSSTYRAYDVKLEKKNWTISFDMIFPEINAGETVDIFTTSGRDGNQGIAFSIKRETGGCWAARIKLNGTTYWHKGISYEQHVGATTNVCIEIEWTDETHVRTRVYYNGVENTSASAYPKETDKTLDYDTTAAADHTPISCVTFGSFNSSLNAADSGVVCTTDRNEIKNYNVYIDNVIICEGLVAEEVSES